MKAVDDPRDDDHWTRVINATDSPECNWKCETCGKETLIHSNFTNANIKPCAGVGRCYTMESVIKVMLAFRRWIFIKSEKKGKSQTIDFICSKGHADQIKYERLKTGSNCSECTKLWKSSQTKNPTRKEDLNRPDCNCLGSTPKVRPRVCSHYNHRLLFPDSASEWDYDKNNGIRPENIAPCTGTEYYWICSNEWCGMSYPQRPNKRSQGASCPYCSGQAVCHWNCLKTNYPELCEELASCNTVDPTTITSGSATFLMWVCYRHPEIDHVNGFVYPASAHDRTSGKKGCPRCVRGATQKFGGHDAFVIDARKIHGNKYEYPDEYKGAKIPINITCLVIQKGENKIIHGNFPQTPNDHKNGQGCPKCSQEQTQSKLITALEKSFEDFGYLKGIKYFRELTFKGLRFKEELHLDIGVPNDNLGVEGDGVQHFKMAKGWGGVEALKIGIARDITKDIYFVENKINFVRIPFTIMPTVELIKEIIDLCRSKKQIYATYRHYYDEVIKVCDLSNVHVIIVPCPQVRI